MSRILIKNGLLIDGTGKPGFVGNLVIEGDLIASVGADESGEFDKIIDAEGLAVSPGFIDTHSHSDLQLLIRPSIEHKLLQGVTTEIIGQDGISMSPLPAEMITEWRKVNSGFNGDDDSIDWNFRNTQGYFKLLENAGIGLNAAYLVPHGNIRMEVLGLGDAKPTCQELKQIKNIALKEMKYGAYGMSTGLIYPPCVYSTGEELMGLCRAVAALDGVFAFHQRSEADFILDSMKELIRLGRETGVKIHFSHFKVCGRKNWSKIDAALELLDKAASEGIRVSMDQYPYAAGSTTLSALLPPWIQSGGIGSMLSRLERKDIRESLIRDIESGIDGWDNFIDFAGFDQIFITGLKTEKNLDIIGKSIEEISVLKGKSQYEVIFDLLCEEEGKVNIVDFYGNDTHIEKILKSPFQNVCTDGFFTGQPHPRLYGTYPRILGRFVRERKVISLEAAVRKMTSKAAETFEFKKRGRLEKGYYADITVFNPDTVKDMGDFNTPQLKPIGIDYVIVNGEIAVNKGIYTQKTAGRVLQKAF